MEPEEHFKILIKYAEKYCAFMGAGQEVLLQTYNEQSDWSFIIQIDAFLETGCREAYSKLLTLKHPKKHDASADLSDFVARLGYQGRTSLLGLLKLDGMDRDRLQFIECVRQVRNAFAHDIQSVDKSLFEIINAHKSKQHILKVFSFIDEKGYDEATFIKAITSRSSMLRFTILHQTMLSLAAISTRIVDL